jgi:hypothetical protein
MSAALARQGGVPIRVCGGMGLDSPHRIGYTHGANIVGIETSPNGVFKRGLHELELVSSVIQGQLSSCPLFFVFAYLSLI